MELTVLCYGIVTLFNNKIAIICMELLPRTIILIDVYFFFHYLVAIGFRFTFHYILITIIITHYRVSRACVFNLKGTYIDWNVNYLVTLVALYLPNRQFILEYLNRRDLIFREKQSSARFSIIQTLTNPISTNSLRCDLGDLNRAGWNLTWILPHIQFPSLPNF